MPKLTRYAIRAAMLWLLIGLSAGILYWANQLWDIAPWLAAFSPTYLHILVVGWLTQLIFAVIYWMFPIIHRDNMRGDPRLAWATLALINGGLLLRVIGEPWRALDPNAVNGVALLGSAIVQAVSGYGLVAVCWRRVRERAGSAGR